ncbi:MAG: DNA repair protein RecO [Magnetococcales bacterium]|nr:DNA repair protein RecO [Magnetococcales bacterium]
MIVRFHDRALVLRRIPFQEASLVVHLLTRAQGARSVIARGVRKRKGPERASLAGFHTIDVRGYCRSACALGTLVHADIVRGRHRLRETPLALAAAQVIQEMLYRYVPQGAPHIDLFDHAETILDRLDAGQDPLALLAFMQGVTLRAIGYGWRVDCCVGCGGTAALGYFSVRRAQTVCQPCGQPYADHIPALDDDERRVMAAAGWSDDFSRLAPGQRLNLFHIGSRCLSRFGGHILDAERLFHQLLDARPPPNLPA